MNVALSAESSANDLFDGLRSGHGNESCSNRRIATEPQVNMGEELRRKGPRGIMHGPTYLHDVKASGIYETAKFTSCAECRSLPSCIAEPAANAAMRSP